MKGKRKALNDNPEAQLAAISEAFCGKIPIKPLGRRSPCVYWIEDGVWHILRVRKGEVIHRAVREHPECCGKFYLGPAEAFKYLVTEYGVKAEILEEVLVTWSRSEEVDV